MDAVRPSSTPLRQLAGAAILYALLPPTARPNKLVITSVPAGAAVQNNGVFVGRTPYQKDIPGGYLHKTKTSLGSRLEHPMIARLTLDGYAAKEIQLTEGPTNWVSLKGHNYGGYWLLKTDHFQVELQSASQTFTGGVESAAPRPQHRARSFRWRNWSAIPSPRLCISRVSPNAARAFSLPTPESSPPTPIWRVAKKHCSRRCRTALNWKPKLSMSIPIWISRSQTGNAFGVTEITSDTDWTRSITILKDSTVTVRATLDPN